MVSSAAIRELGRGNASALNRLEEHLPPILEWPYHMRDIMLSMETFKYSQRFRVAIFLLGNRVPPRVIAEYMKPRLRDKSAREHVATLMKAHRDGVARRWHFFDLATRRQTELCTPTFAVAFPQFWNEAIAIL